LPAGDFAPLVGLSKHTLYLWKKRFAQHGPAGLTDRPRGASSGSKLSEVTKRTIVMLKQLHPDKERRFERARPNQLWQTDLFTFTLSVGGGLQGAPRADRGPLWLDQYNGGVERANRQMAGYQEAVAEFRGRPAGPTREDAETARQLNNELARPAGVRGSTAGELWAAREPISPAQRAAFLATVEDRRAEVRRRWGIAPEEPLTHYPAAAIDRRAVRDALVAHDLLRILPRRRQRPVEGQNLAPSLMTSLGGAGIIQLSVLAAPPAVGGARDSRPHVAAGVQEPYEEAHSSTNKTSASGQNYG
jgi:hypothetical protein